MCTLTLRHNLRFRAVLMTALLMTSLLAATSSAYGFGSAGGSSGFAAPSVQIVNRGTTGQAPFTVFVHGLNTSLQAGDPLTAHYRWDFGDPGSPHNQITGWNAAHTYDQPGTYTVTLTVTNQNGAQSSKTLTVNVQADNRTKIHVSTSGSNSNSGSESQPVKTLAHASSLLGPNTMILLKRGQTFTLSSTSWLEDGNIVIGAYGSGARPLIRWTGDGGSAKVFYCAGSAKNIVIQDLAFESDNPAGNRAVQLGEENITVRRCSFNEIGYAANGEFGADGVALFDNDVGDIDKYFFIGWGTDHNIVGNTIAGSVTEHPIRLRGIDRILVAYNNITNDINFTNDIPKNTIWAMHGTYGYFSHNEFYKGPVKVSRSDPDDFFHWAVFEANFFSGHEYIVKDGAEHIMFRNNISVDNSQAYVIEGYSGSMNRTTKDIRIINNTHVFDEEKGRFIEVLAEEGPANGLYLANNLFVAPNLVAGHYRSANIYALDGTQFSSFDQSSHNVWIIPDDYDWVSNADFYCWPGWAFDEGFNSQNDWQDYWFVSNDIFENVTLNSSYEPPAGSDAASHAVPYPGIHTDFYGNFRQSGLMSAGAVDLYAEPDPDEDPKDPKDPVEPGAADVNQDGAIDIYDILLVLQKWGECPGTHCELFCLPDIDGDCTVGVLDLIIVLNQWE